MAVVELVSAVRLRAVGHVLLVGALCDARVQQVAGKVRDEGEARVTRNDGTLDVERALRMLPAERAELRHFALVLIERLARVGRYAVHGIAQRGLLAVQVRNLKFADGTSHHERDAVVVVEDVFEVPETVILGGMVMYGVRAAVGRLAADMP